MKDDVSNAEATCRHPDCTANAEEMYADRWGNELELCDEHYFEAVFPIPVSVVSREKRKEKDESGGILRRMFT